MKDKLILKTREQMDLLTDPFALDILQVMHEEKGVTKEWIAKELGENLDIITDYVERMTTAGFFIVDNDGEKCLYRMAARSIEGGKLLFQDEMDKYWISGFVNYLENSFHDFFDYMLEIEGDRRDYLEKKGFNREIFSDFSTVYLTQEEYNEFFNYLEKFILEKSAGERKNDDKYKPYNMFTFLFPKLRNKKSP